MATATAPRLVKVARGHYTTEDGRYVLWALSGWGRGYWQLIDTQAKTQQRYEGKRAAVAALRGYLSDSALREK